MAGKPPADRRPLDALTPEGKERTAEMRKHPGRSWRLGAYHTAAVLIKRGPADNRVRAGQDGSTFDELVIDDWFHIEQMDDRRWWMRVGDQDFDIDVPADRRMPATIRHRELGDLAARAAGEARKRSR